MSSKGIRALALSGALVGWSFTAGLDRPWRRHPVVQAGVGTALAVAARAPLGLRPPPVYRGLRLGAGVAATVTAGVAAATKLTAVRSAMRDRSLPPSPWHWLAV